MSDMGYLIRDISTPVLQKLTGSCLPLLISQQTRHFHTRCFPYGCTTKTHRLSSFHQIPEQFGTLRSVFHSACNEFYVVLTKSTLFAHLILAVCQVKANMYVYYASKSAAK